MHPLTEKELDYLEYLQAHQRKERVLEGLMLSGKINTRIYRLKVRILQGKLEKQRNKVGLA